MYDTKTTIIAPSSPAPRALATIVGGLLVGLLTSCAGAGAGARPDAVASSAASSHDGAPGGGAMMRLEDEPLEADWEGWTPATGATGTPELSARAFDYWQLEDAGEMEFAWSAISSILSALRQQGDLPPGTDDTIRMLMTVLEPGAGEDAEPTRIDLTFLIDDQLREGVLVRVYRTLANGASPGVSVAIWRQTGLVHPKRAQIWLHSDVIERPSLSAIVEETSAGWGLAHLPGIEAHLPIGQAEGETARAIASLLLREVWNPLTGPAYLDPPFAWKNDAWTAPPTHPAAAGLELRDRDVEQVFIDSAFPPRFTGPPLRTGAE